MGCIQRQSTDGRDNFQATIAVHQTIQNFKDAIQIADNNRDRLATAATNGYGVAAAARPPSDNSLLLEQFAAMAARIDAWESKTNPPVHPKKDSQEQYCYTHGLCAHSSKEFHTPGRAYSQCPSYSAKHHGGSCGEAQSKAKLTARCRA